MLSIEAFAAVNMAMNLAVLGTGARMAGQVCWKRIWLASATGTLYAAAAYAGPGWLKCPMIQLLIMGVLSIILSGGRMRRMGRSLTGVALAAALAGGHVDPHAQRHEHEAPEHQRDARPEAGVERERV